MNSAGTPKKTKQSSSGEKPKFYACNFGGVITIQLNEEMACQLHELIESQECSAKMKLLAEKLYNQFVYMGKVERKPKDEQTKTDASHQEVGRPDRGEGAGGPDLPDGG